MKIRITLHNHAGELDRQTIDVRDDDDSTEISECIHSALDTWILSPGDIIKVDDVSNVINLLDALRRTTTEA